MTNWPKLMKKQWELSTQMQHEFNTNSKRRYVTFSNHEISKRDLNYYLIIVKIDKKSEYRIKKNGFIVKYTLNL